MKRAPRQASTTALQQALRSVQRLSAADVAMMVTAMRTAVDGLLLGQRAGEHWLSLADTANVAETLAGMGIGGGEEAARVVADAQEALAYAAQERRERGTWALRADERDELRTRLTWLCSVHAVQLSACSYGEFERAYRRTAERVRQARRGNVPRDAFVVEGVVG